MFQKALETVAKEVCEARVKEKLDAKTDTKNKQLSWSILLGWVHDAILFLLSKFTVQDPPSKCKGILFNESLNPPLN